MQKIERSDMQGGEEDRDADIRGRGGGMPKGSKAPDKSEGEAQREEEERRQERESKGAFDARDRAQEAG